MELQLLDLLSKKEITVEYYVDTNKLYYNNTLTSEEYDTTSNENIAIAVVTTDECNMKPRCSWCYAKYMPYNKKQFNYDRYARVIDTGRIKGISLYGGEPLLSESAVYELVKLKTNYPILFCSIATSGILLNKYVDLLAYHGIRVRLEATNFLRNYKNWPNIYKLVDKNLLGFSLIKFANGRNVEGNNLFNYYNQISEIIGKRGFLNKCYLEMDIDNMGREDFDFSDFVIESILVNVDSTPLYGKKRFNQRFLVPTFDLCADNDGMLLHGADYATPLNIFIDEVDPFAASALSCGHYYFIECHKCILRNFCRFRCNDARNCTRFKYNAVVTFLQALNKELNSYFGAGVWIPLNGDEFFELPELEFSKLDKAIIRNQ